MFALFATRIGGLGRTDDDAVNYRHEHDYTYMPRAATHSYVVHLLLGITWFATRDVSPHESID